MGCHFAKVVLLQPRRLITARMPEGKYFFIKSQLNGLVLDICAGSRDPGTAVITWPKKDSQNDNQLWYVDHVTGTIRSKMHHLCLDVNDKNDLVVNNYDKDRDNQKWEISGDLIRNRKHSNFVLDIAAAKKKPGARVCSWEHHGKENQKWTFEHTGAKYFYIRSQMHGKVIDIKKQKTEPGTKAVMWERLDEPADHQLWYENKQGLIASKLTDFVFDSSDNGKVRLQPFSPDNEHQRWVVCGEKICRVTNPDLVLDIKGAATKDGAKLLEYEWHGSENQKWRIEEVDL